MRSPYLLLALCGTGCVTSLHSSQAQVESKQLAQSISPQQSRDNALQGLKKADQLILGTPAEKKEAVALYKLIADVAEDQRKDLYKTGLRDEMWERIGSIARNNVGYSYERGEGVAKDPKFALKMYTEAVQLGDLSLWWNYRAMFNKARCFMHGIGTEKNQKEALALFNQANEWYQQFLKINPLLKDQLFEAAIKVRLAELTNGEQKKSSASSYTESKPMVAISVQPFSEEPIELGQFHKLDEKFCATA